MIFLVFLFIGCLFAVVLTQLVTIAPKRRQKVQFDAEKFIKADPFGSTKTQI